MAAFLPRVFRDETGRFVFELSFYSQIKHQGG